MDDVELDRIGQYLSLGPVLLMDITMGQTNQSPPPTGMPMIPEIDANKARKRTRQLTKRPGRYVSRKVLRAAREEALPLPDRRQSPKDIGSGLRHGYVLVLALGYTRARLVPARRRLGAAAVCSFGLGAAAAAAAWGGER